MTTSRMLQGVDLVDESVAGFDRQLADLQMVLAGHGVACIDHEIEDGGFHLARIDLDLPQPGAADDFEIDILAQRALEEVRHAVEQSVDIDGLRVERLLACEGEQALGQHHGALRAAGRAGNDAPEAIA